MSRLERRLQVLEAARRGGRQQPADDEQISQMTDADLERAIALQVADLLPEEMSRIDALMPGYAANSLSASETKDLDVLCAKLKPLEECL